jgi:5-methylcytosine-specific restriction endonuclease McrA
MNPKRKLQKQCDKLWTQIVLSNKPICEYCGQKAQQAHHFIPKGRSAYLRYDFLNAVSLCMKCHLLHHTGDTKIHAKIVKDRTNDWYNHIMSQDTIKTTLTYYKDKFIELSNQATN